jgi:hypothetical protein
MLISGGRNEGDGRLLRHQAGALLLDYCNAEEIGVALPRRLCIKVTGLRVWECPLSSLAASTL